MPRSFAPIFAVCVLVGANVGAIAGCSTPSTSPFEHTCTGEGQALKICAPGPTVKGVDVAKYDGQVSWPMVKSGGYAFAFARVSDGLAHPDATFATNWTGIKAAGLVRGVYQYFRASVDPIQQADYLLTQVQQNGGMGLGDFPPVLDIETDDGMSAAVVQQNMQTWLDHIEHATGRKPVIYTANFVSDIVGTGFTSYPLWVANYGATCPTMPSGWNVWQMWQTSATGTVPGIAGSEVDLDVFSGTLADLLAFTQTSAGADAGTSADAGDPTVVDSVPYTLPADAGANDNGSKMGDGVRSSMNDGIPCK